MTDFNPPPRRKRASRFSEPVGSKADDPPAVDLKKAAEAIKQENMALIQQLTHLHGVGTAYSDPKTVLQTDLTMPHELRSLRDQERQRKERLKNLRDEVRKRKEVEPAGLTGWFETEGGSMPVDDERAAKVPRKESGDEDSETDKGKDGGELELGGGDKDEGGDVCVEEDLENGGEKGKNGGENSTVEGSKDAGKRESGSGDVVEQVDGRLEKKPNPEKKLDSAQPSRERGHRRSGDRKIGNGRKDPDRDRLQHSSQRSEKWRERKSNDKQRDKDRDKGRDGDREKYRNRTRESIRPSRNSRRNSSRDRRDRRVESGRVRRDLREGHRRSENRDRKEKRRHTRDRAEREKDSKRVKERGRSRSRQPREDTRVEKENVQVVSDKGKTEKVEKTCRDEVSDVNKGDEKSGTLEVEKSEVEGKRLELQELDDVLAKGQILDWYKQKVASSEVENVMEVDDGAGKEAAGKVPVEMCMDEQSALGIESVEGSKEGNEKGDVNGEKEDGVGSKLLGVAEKAFNTARDEVVAWLTVHDPSFDAGKDTPSETQPSPVLKEVEKEKGKEKEKARVVIKKNSLFPLPRPKPKPVNPDFTIVKPTSVPRIIFKENGAAESVASGEGGKKSAQGAPARPMPLVVIKASDKPGAKSQLQDQGASKAQGATSQPASRPASKPQTIMYQLPGPGGIQIPPSFLANAVQQFAPVLNRPPPVPHNMTQTPQPHTLPAPPHVLQRPLQPNRPPIMLPNPQAPSGNLPRGPYPGHGNVGGFGMRPPPPKPPPVQPPPMMQGGVRPAEMVEGDRLNARGPQVPPGPPSVSNGGNFVAPPPPVPSAGAQGPAYEVGKDEEDGVGDQPPQVPPPPPPLTSHPMFPPPPPPLPPAQNHSLPLQRPPAVSMSAPLQHPLARMGSSGPPMNVPPNAHNIGMNFPPPAPPRPLAMPPHRPPPGPFRPGPPGLPPADFRPVFQQPRYL